MEMAEEFPGFSNSSRAYEPPAALPVPKEQSGVSPVVDEGRFSGKLADCRSDLRAYLGSFLDSETDVEDCFQEVSIALWNKHQQEWTLEDFRRFGFRVARNQAAYLLRKRKRTPLLGPELADKLASRIEAMSEETDAREARFAALRDCLGKLPQRHREIVETRYSGSGSLKRLADTSGVTESSIYKRLERIRTVLRDCVTRQTEKAR